MSADFTTIDVVDYIEICADCVPQDCAEDLSAWMDRVKEQAERLG